MQFLEHFFPVYCQYIVGECSALKVGALRQAGKLQIGSSQVSTQLKLGNTLGNVLGNTLGNVVGNTLDYIFH